MSFYLIHYIVNDLFNPLTPTFATGAECPEVKNYIWRLNPVRHRMLYSCTHIATVGIKGLMSSDII